MGAHLDLDDVAAGNPRALAELARLRQALDEALDVVVDLGGEVRAPEMEDAGKDRRLTTRPTSNRAASRCA
jgi:hypothetical protein